MKLHIALLAATAATRFLRAADKGGEAGGSDTPKAPEKTDSIAGVPKLKKVGKERVKLANLKTADRYQPRAGVSEEKIADYTQIAVEAKERGEENPFRDPLHVLRTDKGDYILAGFHRLPALKKAKYDDAEAEIYEGDDLAALIHAGSDNAEHGLPYSNKDKKALLLRLLENKEIQALSNNGIAKVAGGVFTGKFVGDHRPADKTPVIRQSVRKSGKKSVTNTKNIGKKTGKKAAKKAAAPTKAALAEKLKDSLTSHIKKILDAQPTEADRARVQKALDDGSLGLSGPDIKQWAAYNKDTTAKITALVESGMKPHRAYALISGGLDPKEVDHLRLLALGNKGKYEFSDKNIEVVVTIKK